MIKQLVAQPNIKVRKGKNNPVALAHISSLRRSTELSCPIPTPYHGFGWHTFETCRTDIRRLHRKTILECLPHRKIVFMKVWRSRYQIWGFASIRPNCDRIDILIVPEHPSKEPQRWPWIGWGAHLRLHVRVKLLNWDRDLCRWKKDMYSSANLTDLGRNMPTSERKPFRRRLWPWLWAKMSLSSFQTYSRTLQPVTWTRRNWSTSTLCKSTRKFY